jgi:hypothetical protein
MVATDGSTRKPFAISSDRPFTHTGRRGCEFKATRCDFSEGVTVTLPRADISRAELAQDVAGMIGYHATNIWPNLTGGFSGYDNIRFAIEEHPVVKARRR